MQYVYGNLPLIRDWYMPDFNPNTNTGFFKGKHRHLPNKPKKENRCYLCLALCKVQNFCVWTNPNFHLPNWVQNEKLFG